MYDTFSLKNQSSIKRDSRTLFYYLSQYADEYDPLFIIPEYDRKNNYIFLNQNYTDRFYLLNRENPSISEEAKLVLTDKKVSSCFDIVFISNGEKNAEENYKQLVNLHLPNKLHRAQNIQGRNKAYKYAASLSHTPYFFAVFGKLSVNPEFDFTFGALPFDQRHYVFESKNPVNGLQYGHQGMILYNKTAVLANPGNQIDFTLAQLYREIPILSGTANYNYNALSTWRTAFRECLKLVIAKDALSKARLEQWKTGTGSFSENSIQGASDAIAFYARYKDDPQMLLRSYDWPWLEAYFKKTH